MLCLQSCKRKEKQMREKMLIKRRALHQYLARLGMTEKEFFKMLELDVESYLHLQMGGNSLDYENSIKFVNAIGADHLLVAGIIDWEGMNVRRPNFKEICAYAN